MTGSLFKRASKVHITQHEDALRGKPREWVSRHFRLIREHRLLVYMRNAMDPMQEARGIVALDGYSAVVDADEPAEGLHAFGLEHSSGDVERLLVLACTSAADKSMWAETIAAVLAERQPTPDGMLEGGGARSTRPPQRRWTLTPSTTTQPPLRSRWTASRLPPGGAAGTVPDRAPLPTARERGGWPGGIVAKTAEPLCAARAE